MAGARPSELTYLPLPRAPLIGARRLADSPRLYLRREATQMPAPHSHLSQKPGLSPLAPFSPELLLEELTGPRGEESPRTGQPFLHHSLPRRACGSGHHPDDLHQEIIRGAGKPPPPTHLPSRGLLKILLGSFSSLCPWLKARLSIVAQPSATSSQLSFSAPAMNISLCLHPAQVGFSFLGRPCPVWWASQVLGSKAVCPSQYE